jgi:hypothetical protein
MLPPSVTAPPLSRFADVVTARMIARTMPTVHIEDRITPASARPRPFCPVRLVWLSAMNPKMNPSRMPPMMPKISEAIAKPLVPGFCGCGCGGG